MIASGALTPRKALALAAACELLGPLLLGVAVASAIGRGIVSLEAATRGTLIAALLGASAWGILAGRLGLPTSATHALVGGLVGAALIGTGPGAIIWRGLAAVAVALGLAPLLGLLCGYATMKALLAVGFYLTPAINSHLRRLQIVTSALVALSHGANDAQKGMGIITAGLVAAVALGGRRTLRTLGMRIYTIRPLHGFAAQATAGPIVIAASLLGGPASTTQVATAAIFGVGAAERITKVRWEVGQSIIIAWLVTVPFAALAAATISLLGLALRDAA